MVKLIIGIKGTGKTKTLIQMVNSALETTGGNVVVLEKGEKLRYDIKYQARLVNTDEYYVSDAQSLYGFVAGLLASNHDITELFIDSALKICKDDVEGFREFAQKVTPLLESQNVNFTMTASIEVEKIPEELKAYLA